MNSLLGKRDSSKTRVVPVFNQLISYDKTGLSWLDRLLKLPHIPTQHGYISIPDSLPVIDLGWGNNEKALDPPISLLRWLINNLEIDPEEDSTDSEATRRKRKALFQKDPEAIKKALSLLERPKRPGKAWYILEGKTQPDVYIETSTLIIVIEGKRTEPTSTLNTKWMPVRHQMLRHLDCAWEVKGSREVFGFFILEGEGRADAVQIPKHWISLLSETVSTETINRSLPHRNIDERERIAKSFLGATTWQKVCIEFGIDWNSLPNTC